MSIKQSILNELEEKSLDEAKAEIEELGYKCLVWTNEIPGLSHSAAIHLIRSIDSRKPFEVMVGKRVLVEKDT